MENRMENGMENGYWKMENGKWKMEIRKYGKWKYGNMENGNGNMDWNGI
jgi:hypothetical protein